MSGSGVGSGSGNVQAEGSSSNSNSQGYFQADIPSVHVSSAEVPQQSQQGHQTGFLYHNQGHEPATAEMAQAAQLGNWFWGNQYMMGLLEEDLSQFNPGW